MTEYEYEDNAVVTEEETTEAEPMSEADVLAGLLEDNVVEQTVRIKRGNKVRLELTLHSLTETEINRARKNAIPRGKNGKKGELNQVLFRSWEIYLATQEGSDGKKVWDNPRLYDKYGVMQGVDVIDHVLLAGEKAKLLDVIDEISGYGEDEEEEVKN
ncbi:MAG: hypothetical protein LBQ91_06260 [Oscillospiraceae bacterium]|jgi:hypothetical protein|nr:hypothetical protein [Oscillospiraceae bacterium]